jgi:hypothetical protein
VPKFGATSGGADAGISEPGVLGVPVIPYGKRNPLIGRGLGILPKILSSGHATGSGLSAEIGGSLRPGTTNTVSEHGTTNTIREKAD